MSKHPIVEAVSPLREEMTRWRRDIHRHPETAYEEHRTAKIVSEALRSFGMEVTESIGGTGVVGQLTRGRANRAIGLRADMDALNLQELNDFAHRSVNDGKMHACGHDGHTAMLLGAAKHLSEDAQFEGTVYFIFQPAEEGGHGAKGMIDDGLFDRFPCETVFGMHNMPGYPVGTFAVRNGPILAAVDEAHAVIHGTGGHGAFPHLTKDPVLAAAKLVEAWNTIVSRRVSPLDNAVVSVTQIQGSDAINVIPDSVAIGATVRTLRKDTREQIKAWLESSAKGIAMAQDVEVSFEFVPGDVATVNSAEETDICVEVAKDLVGSEHVMANIAPMMGSEDFGWMLEEKPGCYIFIGNGVGEMGGCMVHNPHYDFNDEILALGAGYWISLTRTLLPIM
jgi:hippurate hydrolase